MNDISLPAEKKREGNFHFYYCHNRMKRKFGEFLWNRSYQVIKIPVCRTCRLKSGSYLLLECQCGSSKNCVRSNQLDISGIWEIIPATGFRSVCNRHIKVNYILWLQLIRFVFVPNIFQLNLFFFFTLLEGRGQMRASGKSKHKGANVSSWCFHYLLIFSSFSYVGMSEKQGSVWHENVF